MRRAASWIAAGPVAAIIATMFVTGGSAAAGEQGPVSDTVYGCKVAASTITHRIKVRQTVTMKSPEAVGVDQRTGRVTMKVVMPRSILEDLSPGQTVDSLTVVITPKVTWNFRPEQGGEPTENTITWRQLRSPAKSPVAQTGDVRIPAATWNAGRAGDPFKAAVPGTVTYYAASLTMAVTPPVGGAKTVECVAEGKVAVAKQTLKGPKTGEDCPPVPTATALNPDFEVPSVPPTARPGPTPVGVGCTKIKGFANIRKLDGGTAITTLSGVRGLTSYIWTKPKDPPPGTQTWLRLDYVGENQPVRATGTFLTFGFVPTTTTIELTQIGVANVHLVDSIAVDGADDLTVVANAKVSMRVVKASVNGQNIEVGPKCRASRPIELKLRGGEVYDPPYQDSILVGGVLRGMVEIPPFVDCGVGEDFSRLLTAAASGKDNEVQVTQGALCGTAGAPSPQCPPEVSINGKKAATTRD